MNEYATTGDLARELAWPLHRVTYAVQRLGIVEDGRAGTYRLFRYDRVPWILIQIRGLASSKNALVGNTHQLTPTRAGTPADV